METMLDRVSLLRSLAEQAKVVRESTVSTLRALEQRLVEALNGEHLRGLVSLADSRPHFYAARVHGSARHGIDTFLPPGEECLVLGKVGLLLWARYEKLFGEVHWRAVQDEELRREDLEPAVLAVAEALRRHLGRVEELTVRNARLADLSLRVSAALR